VLEVDELVNYNLSRRDARFSAVFLSPFDRLEQGPVWAKAIGAIGAIYQYLRTDAFSGALLLVVFIGMIDYWLGVKAAKSTNSYDPIVAHRGVMGKICGVLLLFLVRLVEGYIGAQGLGDTKGAAATAIAISLFAVDLQSIAHHREAFGAQPIPILSAVLAWIQRLATAMFASRLPPDLPGTPQRRAEDPKP
jgi:holin family protein